MKSFGSYCTVILALLLFGIGMMYMKARREIAAERFKIEAAGIRSEHMERQLEEDRRSLLALRSQLSAELGQGGSRNQSGRSRSVLKIPIYQRLEIVQAGSALDARYGPLFGSLGLTSDQVAQLKGLLAEKKQAGRDAINIAIEQGIDPRADSTSFAQAVSSATGPIDQLIQALLGSTGMSQLQAYEQTLPERAAVSLLQQSLSYTSTPLTDAQASQLTQMFVQNNPLHGQISMSDSGPLITVQAMPVTVQQIAQAQEFLSASQVEGLQQLQQRQQLERQLKQSLKQSPSPVSGGPHG